QAPSAWTQEARAEEDSTRRQSACIDCEIARGIAEKVTLKGLLGAVQSQVAATDLRNGWFTAAGVSTAIGAVATFWALKLPTTIKAQAQIALRPGGLVVQGTF
ncbi:MAG: hypothetical protein ABI134_20970, partial [Byssovorax sp.]